MSTVAANNEIVGRELAARAPTMEGTPQFIELETTSRCNIDCLQCPREPGPQGIDVPQWILDALAPYWGRLQNLSLHGLGEPLMAKRTDAIVRSLAPESHVWFSSNLQILTERHLELFRHRRGVVSCSLDAATPETYALVRGGPLDRALANLTRLRAGTALTIFINMTVMKMNFHEVGAFLDLGRRHRVDKVVLLRLNEGDGYVPRRERGAFVFEYDRQHLAAEDAADVARQIAAHPVPFPVEDTVNLKVHEPAADPEPAPPAVPALPPAPDAGPTVAVVNPHQDVLCHMPWTNLHVKLDGSVRVCCHQEAFANLADRSVADLWNGPELGAMREAIGRGTLHPLCHRDNCPVYREWRQGNEPSLRPWPRVRRAVARAAAALAPAPPVLSGVGAGKGLLETGNSSTIRSRFPKEDS